MKNFFFLITLLLTASVISTAAITVKIDLKNSENGIVKVEMTDLHLSDESATLMFPKVIPGMYEDNSFGKYIHDVFADYANGDRIKLKRENKNAFKIKNASRVVKISYTVKQTNYPGHKNDFFLAAGSVFNENYCLLNFHALVGYFPKKQDETYIVAIAKKGDFFGVGSLDYTSHSAQIDSLRASNYSELIDRPMLYGKFSETDTATVIFNGLKVNVAITPNEYGLTATRVEKAIVPILKSLEENPIFKEIFPDSYSFLICIDPKLGFYSGGGLEHNLSSVYFLNDTTGLDNFFKDLIAHEIIHVLSPLQLRSEFIDHFDLNKPVFSQHLWFYEGMTEYLSIKCNLDAGVIDTTQFFRELLQKDMNASRFAHLSMTEASAHVLSNKNQRYYPNFYEKGAIVGFYLDYLIAKESNGDKGIFNLIAFLLDEYGSEKPFLEKELFQIITKEFPETKTCFDQMVIGENPVPLKEVLENLEVKFVKATEPIERTIYNTGIYESAYWNSCQCIVVKNQPFNKEIGKRKIKIYTLNNEPVNVGVMRFLNSPKSADEIVLGIDKHKTETLSLYPKQEIKTYFPTRLSLPDEVGKSILVEKVLEF